MRPWDFLTRLMETKPQRQEREAMERAREAWYQAHVAKRLQALPSVSNQRPTHPDLIAAKRRHPSRDKEQRP